MWSSHAEAVVKRLITSLPTEQLGPARTHAARLDALPIGGSMWADYYLRANGEVIIVGEDFDHPDVDSVYTDRLRVLSVLVWGAERYPELRDLLPEREPGATDCQCRQYPDFFGPGKIICQECGGVGWLPAGSAEQAAAADAGRLPRRRN
ncbi:MAG TPA: hypothetical protein VJ739_10695 [Gemmataceae bacterium]|nr:hypothetical protein [Gemmataceae bacterium]